ncbi:uncharacterized protein LOC106170498 [Lingula anatina]|uniref:Uncharacterized protein LOC106170498 n=1 Tax=Lingula anatina TaxID=7574 RepID=A0A1S3J616_LINAN|nr:uncharacterized protein LOC106170498 [Lingula anatina]|eukprot:XP_013405835.1 uncharacterized protein LOC106170498 [Lingula anatina]
MAIGIQAPSTSQQPADRTLSAEIPPDWEAPPPVDSGSDDYLKGAAAPPPGDSGSDDYLKGAAGPPSGDSGSDDYLKGAAERINVKEIDPMLLAKIEAMARGKTVEPEKQITIWDFAGQDIYYTTHQTFLSEQNIYLLVFRLDLGLNAEITVYRRKKTVKEFIVFWLNSIHMHTIGKSTEEDKNICPRVFIIGTHKDKVNAQDADKIFVDLGEYLDDKQVLKGHVHGYFAISNLASEVEFDGIKGAIEELCDDISSSGVSVSWIQLEMNLAKKSEEKPIISMVELCEMAQVVGLPDRELHDSFIPEHHRLGDILHFKVDGLENVVIIDPLWLADRFSEIMTPVNIKSGSGYLDIQQGDLIRGVLKEEVFDAYLHKIKMTERKTDLIQLMLHFDLMLEISQSVENPLPYFGKRTFIVPSMLVPSDSVDPALSETDPKKYLLISFPHVMFHPGLFHRLIIRLLRKYKAQRYKKNIPVVGFDRASFLLEDDKSVLHLVIEDKDMKMMITNASPSPTGPHIYSNARQTVVEELEILLKAYCPRLQFCYCIRDKNDGPNIQIKADDVYKNDFVSKYVENSAKSIDLRPYRVWFSAAGKVPHSPQPLAEAAGKVPHSPQPLDEAVGKVPHKLQPLNEECTKQEAANGQGFSLDPSSHHHHHYHYNTTYCTHNNINNCQYVQVGNENVMERVPEFLSEPPSDAEHLDLDTNPR